MTNDPAPHILIVSTKVDIATDYVTLKLSEAGARFFRVNTEDFPLDTPSSFRIGRSDNFKSWRWMSSPSSTVELSNVRAVWYRRHRLARMPHEMAEAHTEYCLRESEWFIKGSVLALDQRSRIAWMSHPASIQMAESKLYQLSTANSLGFKLPETLVSNDPGEVRDFFTKKQGKIIAKPLRLGYFDYGDHQTSVYTNLVEWKHLQDDNSIRVSPVIFQELIPKRFDIRITIVGKRVFAVAIDSQSVESAKIDWRRTDTPELPHIIHDLPPSLEAKCLEYMLALGLNYGALDFVVTPDEEYIFLEINPNGQWVWMEDMLGLPISESIAAWLQDHAGN